MQRMPMMSKPHEVLMAILRPQLSETYGIKKKPMMDPAYKSDSRMGLRYSF